MQLYSSNQTYKLFHGNMLDMGQVIESGTIDSIVTDPPYELNFMGKGWDNSGIAFQKETWKKCLDALKPGGYLLAFGGSRTYHRIACAIEDAGFEIRDCIMWLYGSGFPKSMNISKQIDKKGGDDYSKEFANDLKKAREVRGLTMSECDRKYCGGTTNWSWYEGRPAGVRVPDYNTYLNIVSDFTELEKYRELIKEAEREVIGKKEYTSPKKIIDPGNYDGKRIQLYNTIPSTDLAKKRDGWGTALKPSYEPIIVARKPLEGSCTDNVIKYGVGGINIDECRVGNEEKTYTIKENGFGDNFMDDNRKPSGKEYEKTVTGRFPANTILTYDESDFEEVCGGFPNSGKGNNKGAYNYAGKEYNNSETSMFNGDKPQAPSNYNDSGSASRYYYTAKASKRDRDEGLGTETLVDIILSDKSGKIWKGENIIRDEKLVNADIEAYLKSDTGEYEILNKEDLDLNIILYMKNIIERYLNECKSTTKMGINSTTIYQILNWLIHLNTKENTLDVKQYDEKYISHVENAENGNLFEITIEEKSELAHDVNNAVLKMQLRIKEKEKHSTHPTVKPTDLMQYLVRLVTPNGGTVLDPFNGSGSTGKAVMYENKDRNKNYKYIGIELTEEYLPIAKARIEYVINKGVQKSEIEESKDTTPSNIEQWKESALF